MKKKEGHRLIHRHLEKKHPAGVKKAKRLFSFKYPKLFLLIVSIIIAYLLFSNKNISNYIPVTSTGYLTSFIGSILASFGFTTAFGIGFLLNANPGNIFLAAIIGGIGAMILDMFIFKFIKFSFTDEFNQIKKTSTIKTIKKIISKNKSLLIRHYLLYIFAGIIIASPLPDELGVSMLAGLTTINAKTLALVSFILHTLTVFLILYLGVII